MKYPLLSDADMKAVLYIMELADDAEGRRHPHESMSRAAELFPHCYRILEQILIEVRAQFG